jgi:hypothetical protein
MGNLAPVMQLKRSFLDIEFTTRCGCTAVWGKCVLIQHFSHEHECMKFHDIYATAAAFRVSFMHNTALLVIITIF